MDPADQSVCLLACLPVLQDWAKLRVITCRVEIEKPLDIVFLYTQYALTSAHTEMSF